MNKNDLSTALSLACGLTKADASNAVDAIFNAESGILAKAMKAGDKVSLQGFGSFERKAVAARTGMNPSTKAKIQIAASSKAKFTAGSILKATIA